MTTQEDAKKLVGQRGAELVESGMTVGLGTGTTATYFIHALATRNAQSSLNIRCVASSDASTALARNLGLIVTTLNELSSLDIYIDGADEVDPNLNLIKGGGGAQLREKIVASAAARFVVLVDSSKLVPTLGKFPLPIEVVKMAYVPVQRKLDASGLSPVLRLDRDAHQPFVTDEGNYILDCHCGPISDPYMLAKELRSVAGVIEHGLFLGMTSTCFVAGEDGLVEMTAPTTAMSH